MRKAFRRLQSNSALEEVATWEKRAFQSASDHGARPYMVEGFLEISDAVKRGHSVLIKREAVEVAKGITVFTADSEASPVAAILSFDLSTARFVLQDAANGSECVELTPRRLAVYLEDPNRSIGVALGA